MNNNLIPLALQQLPALLVFFRELFANRNPTDQVPTDAEIMTAFEQAFVLSRAKDDAWLAAHPPA